MTVSCSLPVNLKVDASVEADATIVGSVQKSATWIGISYKNGQWTYDNQENPMTFSPPTFGGAYSLYPEDSLLSPPLSKFHPYPKLHPQQHRGQP